MEVFEFTVKHSILDTKGIFIQITNNIKKKKSECGSATHCFVP